MSVRPPSPLPLVRRCRRRWRRRLLRSFSSILPFPSCPPPLRRPQSFSQLNWLAPLLSSSPFSIPLAESRTDGHRAAVAPRSPLNSLDRDCPKSPPNLTCTIGRKERAAKKTNGIGRRKFSPSTTERENADCDAEKDGEKEAALPMNLKSRIHLLADVGVTEEAFREGRRTVEAALHVCPPM